MFGKVARGLFCVLAFATGCTSAAGDDSRGAAPYPPAQSWALADGVVSQSEYRKAIDGFVSCVRDAGYSVTEPVLSPIDGLTLLYDLTPSGDPDAWNKKTEDCNQANVSHIEPAYVEGHRQTMAPALQAATVKCLRGKGFDLPGADRNVKDFVEATDRVGNVVMECVTTAVEREFPGMPGLLKIRW